MSLIKKLAGETVIYGLGSVLPRVLNFVVLTKYLTSRLSNEEYGVHGLVYSLSAFLMIALTLRMETTFFRFGSAKGGLEKSFSTGSIALLCTTLIGVGAVLIFPETFSLWFTPSADNAVYMQLVAIVTGLDILCALPYARLRLEKRPVRFATIKIVNVVVMLVSLFFLMEGLRWMESSWYDENYLLHYVFIANIIGSFCGFILLSPIYRRTKWTFDKALFQKMMWYALPLIVVGFAGYINGVFDRVLLGKLIAGDADYKEAQVGIFNACVKIAVFMELFITAFNYAAEPFFFRNAQDKNSKKVYAQVGQLFTIVACVGFLLVLLYLDIFKHLIASKQWVGLVIVPFMLLAYLFKGLFYNFSIWYKLVDKTWIGGVISVCGSIILLSINFSLVGSYGYIAAAWAVLACFTFMAVASYLIGQKYYPIPYPIGRMLAYIVFAVIIYLVSSWLQPTTGNIVLTLAINTFLLLGYLGAIWFFEKDSILQMLK